MTERERERKNWLSQIDDKKEAGGMRFQFFDKKIYHFKIQLNILWSQKWNFNIATDS